jgi:hypothetical protein
MDLLATDPCWRYVVSGCGTNGENDRFCYSGIAILDISLDVSYDTEGYKLC